MARNGRRSIAMPGSRGVGDQIPHLRLMLSSDKEHTTPARATSAIGGRTIIVSQILGKAARQWILAKVLVHEARVSIFSGGNSSRIGAYGPVSLLNDPTALVALQIDDVGLQELVETVFAVGASDAAFSPPGMESLHGFEILAVDVGFAKSDFPAGA